MSSALSKLTREPLTAEDVETLFHELETDGPRGVAVLGATLVENSLRRLLLSKMIDLTETEYGKLFIGIAPLGGFSAMIKVGYALGLFGKKTKHDLDLLREIRNAFAHTQKLVSFDTPAIKNAATGFHCFKSVPEPPTTAREQYLFAVHSLAIFLLKQAGLTTLPIATDGLD